MHLDELSTAVQDYLKVIWQATEWDQGPVTTGLLAERLGVSPSTVSEAVSRLASSGLVRHERYRGVELTAEGEVLALAMVRRHRLLETYLVRELSYTWDEVHDEAERLEHAASALLIDRIDQRLGYPTRDPHGDPIPTASGQLPSTRSIRLGELAQDQAARITRISDSDPSMLRYFASVGLNVDDPVVVRGRREFAGVVTVEVASREQLTLAEQEAALIWVALEDPAGPGRS